MSMDKDALKDDLIEYFERDHSSTDYETAGSDFGSIIASFYEDADDFTTDQILSFTGRAAMLSSLGTLFEENTTLERTRNDSVSRIETIIKTFLLTVVIKQGGVPPFGTFSEVPPHTLAVYTVGLPDLTTILDNITVDTTSTQIATDVSDELYEIGSNIQTTTVAVIALSPYATAVFMGNWS